MGTSLKSMFRRLIGRKSYLNLLLAPPAKLKRRSLTTDRIQKEEALKFRVTKTSEVGEIEKELATEISALEKQRDEIKAQLK